MGEIRSFPPKAHASSHIGGEVASFWPDSLSGGHYRAKAWPGRGQAKRGKGGQVEAVFRSLVLGSSNRESGEKEEVNRDYASKYLYFLPLEGEK